MTQETVKAAYRRKLASNPDGEITVDTVEIYHPLISKRYRLVADQIDLVAKLEDGVTDATFEAANISVKGASNNSDMTQSASVTIADPLNELDDELSRIPLSNTDKVTITYRAYLLSDLSYPADGPIVYEARDVTQGKGTFTLSVGAPRLNNRGTGLILTPALCPLIRGVLA